MDERRKGHPPRLPGWDYAAHAPYFVTFKVAARRPRLGRVGGGRVLESRAGAVVRTVWERLPDRFPGVELDERVIMPDHVHAILWMPGPPHTDPCNPRGALMNQGPRQPAQHRRVEGREGLTLREPAGQQATRALIHQGPTGVLAPMMADTRLLLGKVVRAWKAEASLQIRRRVGITDFDWQSRYYEHIVRSPAALARVRAYIQRNPIRAAPP